MASARRAFIFPTALEEEPNARSSPHCTTKPLAAGHLFFPAPQLGMEQGGSAHCSPAMALVTNAAFWVYCSLYFWNSKGEQVVESRKKKQNIKTAGKAEALEGTQLWTGVSDCLSLPVPPSPLAVQLIVKVRKEGRCSSIPAHLWKASAAHGCVVGMAPFIQGLLSLPQTSTHPVLQVGLFYKGEGTILPLNVNAGNPPDPIHTSSGDSKAVTSSAGGRQYTLPQS